MNFSSLKFNSNLKQLKDFLKKDFATCEPLGVPPDRLDEIQPSCSANVGTDDKYKPTYSHKKSQQLKLSYGVSGCAAAAIALSVLQDTD
ncbi:hypothetical protein AVEN_126597-1 [Araneus ventricosus]|uniref:Uncharacterized protein n=1 Tax=Araneus ventricosus TaxID=182803 RepID=A0A4Y2RAB1_ARAVE|nr:hypothetical protein AVEN_126597-1 [Araneus ventricosus]